MAGTIRLETDRLVLRRHIPEDAAELYEKITCDERMTEFTGWNPYATPELAEKTVSGFISSYDDPHFYGWAVTLKDAGDDRIIGTFGAYGYETDDEGKDRIELGCSIFRDYWNKGIAGEALCEIARYLTEEENISCLHAWCDSRNTGSARIMEKAGMKRIRTEKDSLEIDGELYDKYIYAYCV